MRSAVRERFVEFSRPLEGVVPWMYLDVLGLVTTAIGNLIDPVSTAVGLPFVVRATGAPATPSAISAEWWRVKNDASLARLGHRAAERITSLRLTDDGIAIVVGRRLAEMDRHLADRFASWEDWPACAQLATLSLAWACGPAFRFPLLEAALRSGDYAVAAEHCAIRSEGNPGVKPRNALNSVLYRNAARVRDYHLDPDTIDWTYDLSVSDVPTVPALPDSTPIVHADPSTYLRPDDDA